MPVKNSEDKLIRNNVFNNWQAIVNRLPVKYHSSKVNCSIFLLLLLLLFDKCHINNRITSTITISEIQYCDTSILQNSHECKWKMNKIIP